MAYIGREPQIGNFQVCDAISVVNGQAAYTMQVSSVDVIPETAGNAEEALQTILNTRARAYPTWQEQMDMQYKDLLNGTTTWKDTVAKVKLDNPK